MSLEIPLIERVQHELAERTAIVSLQMEPPVGPARLRALVTNTSQLEETAHA